MNNSTLLIQSQDSNNQTMGTGFIIHQDNFGSYVLTCAHVLEQVKKPKIDNFFIEEKFRGSSESVDLAVLYVKGLFRTPFKLQSRVCESLDVFLIGYSRFSQDKYQGKSREATILGKKVTLKGIKDGVSYGAWQIVAKDNNEIEAGNSGGPLICQESGKVIAVVSNNKGVTKGYAVAIEHLKDIWHDAPPFLFESDDEAESPFVGLSAFSIEQSHLFFGRERETREIITRLQEENLIAVVGDSGSGKSSLIKAGVIPKYLNGILGGEEDSSFYLVDTRPAKNPFDELAYSITRIAEVFKLDFESINQMKKAINSKSSEDTLNALSYIFNDKHVHLLIYIDQFEELFTLCSDQVQKEFISMLLYLLAHQTSNLKIKIIFTMRRDYYNLVSEYEEFFRQAQASKYTLNRMKDEQIKVCIEKPLARTFISKERIAPFVKAVLQDMGDKSSELALLQIALTQTWKHKKEYENNLLRTYHEIGEVSGALAKLAQDTWSILNPVEQKILKYIFIRIIQPGETGGVTRRLADREEFSEDAWLLAQKLSSALDSSGKIATDTNAKLGRLLKIKGEDGNVVELTHEALVGQWPMYQRWLKEVNKNHLKRVHDRVIEKTKVYHLNRKKKFLLMGYELEESMKLLDDGYRDYLSEDEIIYIEKSNKQEKKSSFIKRSLLFGLFLLTTISLFLGGYALYQERKVQRVLRDSNIEKGLIYRDELNHPIKAKLLFAKSIISSETDAEQESSKILYHSIKGMKLNSMLKNNSVIWKASFSKNGQYILSASSDKKAKLWEKKSGKLLYAVEHNGTVWGALFSEDKHKVLSWGGNSAKLWRIADGRLVFAPLLHKGIWKAKFSNDKKTIVTWDSEYTKVWDRENGLLVKEFHHDPLISAIAYSNDEKYILCRVAHNPKSVALMRVDSNETVKLFTHDNTIRSARFSDSGDYIFTWDNNGTFNIWDNKSYISVYSGKRDKNIKGLRFNKRQTELLTWGGDKKLDKGTIRLWKVTLDKVDPIKKYSHDRWVNGAEFTKDEQHILSWSRDRTVRLWDKETQNELAHLRHNGSVIRAKFDIKEEDLLTYGTDGLIRIWQGVLKEKWEKEGDKRVCNGILYSKDRKSILKWDKTGNKIQLIEGVNRKFFKQKGEIYGAKFSENERSILSWGSSKEAILWDIQSRKNMLTVEHERSVIGADFDIDNKKILSWSKDGVVKLSDANESKIMLDLRDKGALLRLVLSQDKKIILTWSRNHIVNVWKREEDNISLLKEIKHKGFVEGATFSSNEEEVISWGQHNAKDKVKKKEGVIKITNLNNPEFSHDINDSRIVQGVCFNKKRDKLLTWYGDGTVKLLNYQTEKEILIFKHKDRVRGAIFSENEQRILSWSEDKTLRLWDIKNKKELLTINHTLAVIKAEFINDGAEILSWSYAGVVKHTILFKKRKLKKEDYLLEVEVENGVKLTDVGEMKILNYKGWKKRKERYEEELKEK